MAKYKKKKKATDKKRATQKQEPQSVIIASEPVISPQASTEPLRTKEKIKRFLKKSLNGFLLFLSLFGVVAVYEAVDKWTTSKHEVYEKENFIKGILIPDEILYSTTKIELLFGNIKFPYDLERFKNGFNFTPKVFVCHEDGFPFKIGFKIENKRLYATVSIKDLQKEEIVGIINYNRWSLFKPNLLNYQSDDKRLEVIDRGGNIVFSIKYKYPNLVAIQGYFINEKTASAVSLKGWHICINKTDMNWKSKLLEHIRTINSIF